MGRRETINSCFPRISVSIKSKYLSSFSRQQLEKWLKTIEVKGDKVLDIGGSQNPITKRLKTFEPEEYKILDLEAPHECKQTPDIKFDLNEDTLDCVIPNEEYFDIAFCIEVTEYWWDPISALKNINKILKQDGILYISWHFQYPVHNPVEQDYLRYTPQGVNKLLKETGFEILEETPRLMNKNSEGIYNAFIATEQMRPAKNYDEHNWTGCCIRARKI